MLESGIIHAIFSVNNVQPRTLMTTGRQRYVDRFTAHTFRSFSASTGADLLARSCTESPVQNGPDFLLSTSYP